MWRAKLGRALGSCALGEGEVDVSRSIATANGLFRRGGVRSRLGLILRFLRGEVGPFFRGGALL